MFLYNFFLKSIYSTSFFVLIFLTCNVSHANFDQKAHDIIKKQQTANTEQVSLTAKGKLYITNIQSAQHSNDFSYHFLLNPSQKNSKELYTIYSSDKKKRASLLILTHSQKSHDLWLKDNTNKQPIQIKQEKQNKAFLNSDFTFEDLGPHNIDNYNYHYLNEEPCGADSCHVIEALPKKGKSQYLKGIIWIRKNDMQIVRHSLFNHEGRLVKEKEFKNFKKITKTFQKAHKIIMTNVRQKSYSVFEFDAFLEDKILKDKHFSPKRL